MNSLLPEPLHIDLLSSLSARQGDRVITRFHTYKTAALLAYLAYFLDGSHLRETLIELLWTDGTLERRRNNLSVALSSLRHLLEPPGIPAGALIQADRHTVQLNPIAVTTDVQSFQKAIQAADRASSDTEQAQYLTDALNRYRGPLLPGYYEAWTLTQQAYLQEQFFTAVEKLVAYCQGMGDAESALKFARRTVSADPLREEAHRTLMRLYADAGRREQAVRQYRELERLVREHATEGPSEETRALFEQIQHNTSSLPAAPLPARRHSTRVGAGAKTEEASPPPTGTVTFLLTEIEGSTAQWENAGHAFQSALSLHQMLLQNAFRRFGGFEAYEGGNGFMIAFARPTDALACAAAAQRALKTQSWPEQVGGVQVRMAIYTGETEWEEGSYRGLTVQRASRLLAAGHGGQILCSEATAGLVRRDLETGFRLADLGIYRLRDVELPERIYQMEYPGMSPRAFPPLTAEPHHSGHLPVTLTRFFGRDLELARLQEMLKEEGTRLITLTGTGGTGKTRLAIEAARQAEKLFAGSVWFVALSQVTEAGPMARAIADAMYLPATPRSEPLDQVIRALSGRISLLVLDNLEQLVESCGPMVQTLLDRVADLHLLITTRQRLNLPGERELVVPPLSIPDGRETPERLSLFESVQLFVDRAQGVRPDFQITASNAPAVAELCDRLEGIPLAIELAAARSQVLTPLQMLAQLQNRFEFLVSRRSSEDRHRTMRAALEWSYRLLSGEIQACFARLSVFRGGWTVEAAEVVCETGLALDYLAQLRECSLILAEEQAAGGMRFRMLETVREYAAEKMQGSGEALSVRSRHRDWFLALAEEAALRLSGPEQGIWLGRLETEHDNLRTALAWCLEDGEAEAGLRLAGSLRQFWYVRGYVTEGRKHLEQALGREGAQAATAARAKALDEAGNLAYHQGDYGAARALHQESLTIRRELGDRRGIANSLNNLGNVAEKQGDYGAAKMLHEESLTIRQELGNRRGIAGSLNNLGNVAEKQGDYGAARVLHEESLAIKREVGDKWGIASSLNNLGMVAERQGDYKEARALHEESLAIKREIGDRWGTTYSLNNLGLLAFNRGDYEAALALHEESLAIKKELGDKNGIAVSLHNLGMVVCNQGDYEAARAMHAESLTIRRELGDKWGIAYSLNNLGNVAEKQGDDKAALALYDESLAIKREIGDKWGIALSLMNLGMVAERQGDYDAALALLEESLVIRREVGDRHGIAGSLEGFARLASASNQYDRAIRLLGAAQALRAAIGTPLPPDEREESESNLTTLRGALGEEASTTAWADGWAMTLEQAITYALQAAASQ